MILVKHRSRNHEINPETEILIIGTFNPDTEKNQADFFYGRRQNFLWRLLSEAFDYHDLKGCDKDNKLRFMYKNSIDFTDLIKEVLVDQGKEANYDDVYLDSRVAEWTDVMGQIKGLKKLRKVCFTRKSFYGIPNMKARIDEISAYCRESYIQFQCLTTPSRFYREDKQAEWTKFFTHEA